MTAFIKRSACQLLLKNTPLQRNQQISIRILLWEASTKLSLLISIDRILSSGAAGTISEHVTLAPPLNREQQCSVPTQTSAKILITGTNNTPISKVNQPFPGPLFRSSSILVLILILPINRCIWQENKPPATMKFPIADSEEFRHLAKQGTPLSTRHMPALGWKLPGGGTRTWSRSVVPWNAPSQRGRGGRERFVQIYLASHPKIHSITRQPPAEQCRWWWIPCLQRWWNCSFGRYFPLANPSSASCKKGSPPDPQLPADYDTYHKELILSWSPCRLNIPFYLAPKIPVTEPVCSARRDLFLCTWSLSGPTMSYDYW